MKPDEISEITVAAYKHGFNDGVKRSTKRAQASVKAAHQVEHQIIEDTIRAELGDEAWATVKEALVARRAAMTGDVLGSLTGIMQKLGLGGEIDKLVKLYEREGADGMTKTTVFGLDLENGKPVDFGGDLGVEEETPGQAHARRVAEAVINGEDPNFVMTDDPTGAKEAALSRN